MPDAPPPLLQTFFADPRPWTAVTSGGQSLHLSSRRGALQLDYDFHGQGGFVVARRALDWPMPDRYWLRLRLRAEGAVNDLEIKLVDSSGNNVWRHVLKRVAARPRGRRLQFSDRDFAFAWGPASGGRPARLGAIEFAVVAGAGGRGRIGLDGLEIVPAPAVAAPRYHASSAHLEHPPEAAGDTRGWLAAGDDTQPLLTLDFVSAREFGGLVIDWPDGAPAQGFRVEAAAGLGKRWRPLYHTPRAAGTRSFVALPEQRAKRLRLRLSAPTRLAALQIAAPEFAHSLDDFCYAVAQAQPRGHYPRWLLREQALWTPAAPPAGRPWGRGPALLNEDGVIEPQEAAYTLEPVLQIGERFYTWATVQARAGLRDDWQPLPYVDWCGGDDAESEITATTTSGESRDARPWRLRIALEITASGRVRARYRYTAPDETAPGKTAPSMAATARLHILIRPYQLTPPWQRIGAIGGVHAIHQLRWQDGTLTIDGQPRVSTQAPVAAVRLQSFAEGDLLAALAGAPSEAGAAAATPARRIDDGEGLASAALSFTLGDDDIVLDCLGDDDRAGGDAGEAPSASALLDWSASLADADAPHWRGGAEVEDLLQTARTATAHILLTRAGAALQPGPRRYARSWIRDGAVMGAALLRMQQPQAVRDYLEWYFGHVRSDGYVPCCVDRQGADPLVEHDSHGQLLSLAADYWRYSGDDAFIAQHWALLSRVADSLGARLEDDGLLPISASHEGYLAQPVHAYWDDVWAWRGLRDLARLASARGEDDAAARWHRSAERVIGATFASIAAVRSAKNLDYIPGSREWADLDPTATANAVALLNAASGLEHRALHRTFDLHLEHWRGKRTGSVTWANYSPYEIRIIAALVRLGRRDEALQLLRFYLSDRRPQAWHQWPEIAWHDRRAPAHVGDVPHTWIAAEYLLAARSLFVYEADGLDDNAADGALVLAAGVAAEWLHGEGLQLQRLPTPYGPLSYRLRQTDAHTVHGQLQPPLPCALRLQPPLPAALRSAHDTTGAELPCDAAGVRLPPGCSEVWLRC